jgi:hypothetical protein
MVVLFVKEEFLSLEFFFLFWKVRFSPGRCSLDLLFPLEVFAWAWGLRKLSPFSGFFGD